MQIDAQGKATYKVRHDDPLDWIARDLVKDKLGREATQQEIYKARMDIAKENGMPHPYQTRPGQILKIPDHLKPEQQRTTQTPPGRNQDTGMRADQSNPKADGGDYKIFAPPGVAGTPSYMDELQGAYHEGSKRGYTKGSAPNGNEVEKFETKIGSWPIRKDVRVEQETNPRTGNLERRKVDYPETGVNFTVKTPNGNVEPLENVKSVETKRESNGEYTTVYKTHDGKTYRGVSKPDGTVKSWETI